MSESGQALRRWAPLLLVVLVQVLLVALVPSRGAAPAGTADLLAGAPLDAGAVLPPGDPAALPQGAGPAGADGTAAVGQAGAAAAPGAGGPAAGGTGPVPGAGTAPGGAVPGAPAPGQPAPAPGGGAAGQPAPVPGQPAGAVDRSRCAKDGVRQQDVTSSSPPCVGRSSGDNGGATYRGVTGDTITVLRYRPKSNPQVDAILSTQGLAFSKQREDQAMATYAKFFAKRYEAHGRTIRWQSVQGTCEISPPDIPCFRNEVKRLHEQFKPFAVFWTNATTQAEFFDEWSRLGVLNVGGWHFNARFNQGLRPFHYDVFMDGTRSARTIADYWCKKMQGKNATLAGDPALRTKRRKLGILTQAFPVTKANAADLYAMVTGGMCGTKADAAEPVFTPSNIAQGQQTANVAVQKLKAEGVTTLVLMVDPINPTFTTTAATRQQWFPEHLMSGMSVVDFDALGRLYDQSQWRNAFGPSHLAEPVPAAQTDAARAANDVGEPHNEAGALVFAYMNQIATMVQVAGPQLTPQTVERGMLTLPAFGGWERTKDPQSVLVKYGKGDYTAVEDSKQVVWDPSARSKSDGKAGAYVSFQGGRRYEVGTWPTGEPRS